MRTDVVLIHNNADDPMNCEFKMFTPHGFSSIFTGKHCKDEDDMRKLVEDFYQDFSRTYKVLRKKATVILKLKKTEQESGCYVIKRPSMTKHRNNFEDAKLW